MDEKKPIILVQGHEYMYNLQHKDYNNNLVKYNFWKEIAGELHSQDKEL
jgi:tRNA(His) 5'-end guanylyltransferase